MSELHRALSRRWFDEVWNQRRAEAVAELMEPDGVGHMEHGDFVGHGPFLEVRDRFLSAFPDLHVEVEDVVSEGDRTVVRWRASGTHAGDGLGIAPCHRRVAFRGMTWHRFRDGKLCEGWDGWNQGALFHELARGADAGEAPIAGRRRCLAERLRQARVAAFGEGGAAELAGRLGVSADAWAAFESGEPIPDEVLLAFLAETGAEPRWLLSGEGPARRATA